MCVWLWPMLRSARRVSKPCVASRRCMSGIAKVVNADGGGRGRCAQAPRAAPRGESRRDRHIRPAPRIRSADRHGAELTSATTSRPPRRNFAAARSTAAVHCASMRCWNRALNRTMSQRGIGQRLNLRLGQDLDLRIGRMALAQRPLNFRRRITKVELGAMFGDQRRARRFAAAIIEHHCLRRRNLRGDRLGDVVIIGRRIAVADATCPTAKEIAPIHGSRRRLPKKILNPRAGTSEPRRSHG